MSITKKNLLFRIIIALIFGPAVIFALYSGGVYLLIFLMIIVFGLSSEFVSLPGVKISPVRGGIIVGSCMIIPLLYWLEWQSFVPVVVLVFSAAWFLLELFIKDMEHGLETSAYGVFGIILFGWVPSLAWELNSFAPLFAVLPMVLVWFGDTTAYFVGNWIGGPKMTPVLSPNKTWAGFAGEIIGALIVGLVFRFLWPSVFGWDIVAFSGIAGFIAVGGDLFESKVKREMKIKDSSNAIPGHGGFWDRFDSWLFVQVAAWIYFIIF
ncbi:phosphatidate cytidylyltransferase [bacterium]|nr:phosphatidate cytidylyltransferase [bacterium]